MIGLYNSFTYRYLVTEVVVPSPECDEFFSLPPFSNSRKERGKTCMSTLVGTYEPHPQGGGRGCVWVLG